jgi:hypothetical protein
MLHKNRKHIFGQLFIKKIKRILIKPNIKLERTIKYVNLTPSIMPLSAIVIHKFDADKIV